jgi:hypothetical protein
MRHTSSALTALAADQDEGNILDGLVDQDDHVTLQCTAWGLAIELVHNGVDLVRIEWGRIGAYKGDVRHSDPVTTGQRKI